jgi:Flp pilus assembly protein TadD
MIISSTPPVLCTTDNEFMARRRDDSASQLERHELGGRVSRAGDDPKEAIEVLERALRASPHDPMRWSWTHFLGVSQFRSRDFAKALANFREVLRLRPGHAVVYLWVTASLAHLGLSEEAHAA